MSDKKLSASSSLATAALAMLVLMGSAGLVAVLMDGLGFHDSEGQLALALPLQGIAVGLFVAMRASRSAEGLRGGLGLTRPRPRWTWALLLLVVFAGLVSDAVLQWLALAFPELGGAAMQGLNQALEQRGWRLSLVLFGAVIVAPVYEEMLFRGVVFAGLERSWGGASAVVVSSVLFAAFHVDPVHALAVLPIGLLLGWIRWRSRSILPCIAAHALNNAIWAVGGLAGVEIEVPWQLGLALTLALALGLWMLRPRQV